MRVKFCIFGKVNFIDIKTSRQLTCLYIRPLLFSVYVWPKISQKKKFTMHTFAKFYFFGLIFGFGWQLGWGRCMRVYQL